MREAHHDDKVLKQLSTLDRFLPVWIIAAMVLGLLLGRLIPGLDDALAAVESARCRCRSRSACP